MLSFKVLRSSSSSMVLSLTSLYLCSPPVKALNASSSKLLFLDGNMPSHDVIHLPNLLYTWFTFCIAPLCRTSCCGGGGARSGCWWCRCKAWALDMASLALLSTSLLNLVHFSYSTPLSTLYQNSDNNQFPSWIFGGFVGLGQATTFVSTQFIASTMSEKVLSVPAYGNPKRTSCPPHLLV